jgi:galactonate dehydratase
MSDLRITDVKAFQCGGFTFFKVYTNEGITGIGESIATGRDIPEAQASVLRRIVTGLDPFQIERIWRILYTALSFRYANPMISGLDVALWDIKGKALGVPVYELLGGLYRNRIRLYPHLKGSWNSYPDEKTDNLFSEPWGAVKHTPEELGKNAQALAEEGYTAIKFDPFEPGMDGYHSYRPSEIMAVVERVEAIRDAVGNNVDLMVECHGKFNASTAIRIGKMLEKYNLMWYEEPVPGGMVKAMNRVMQHVNIPVTNGERLNSKVELKEFLENGAVDILMFDCGKVGGLTEARKLCALCETYQVKTSPHNPFGPVNAMAAAHLSAADPAFLIQEHEQFAPWAVTPRIKIVDGYLEITHTPGLGIDIDEEEIARHQALVEQGAYPRGPAMADPEQFVPVL